MQSKSGRALHSNGKNESGKRLNLVHDKRMEPIVNINELNTLEQGGTVFNRWSRTRLSGCR